MGCEDGKHEPSQQWAVPARPVTVGFSTEGSPPVACPHLLFSSVKNLCRDGLLSASKKPTLVGCGRTVKWAELLPMPVSHGPSSQFPDSTQKGTETLLMLPGSLP